MADLSIASPPHGSAAIASTNERPDTLRALETFIDQRHKELVFPPWLEARFNEETRGKKAKLLYLVTVKTLIVYHLFFIGDICLAPDTLGLAALLHFCVVTPAMLAAAWLFRTNPDKRWRDPIAAALPILMASQILIVYYFTRSPNSAHYLYFVLLVAICANTALRLTYESAFCASATIFAMMVGTLLATNRMEFSVAAMQCISLGICAMVTLRGNFDRERDFRRAYLHGLRDRLRFAEVGVQARHDALTGLANRRHLDEVGALLWSGAAADPSPISAILFDIDRFKAFNDIYGHPAGDSCLRRVAACVAAELRGTDDLAARYGGEEFMLLLPRTELVDAVGVADRLRRSIVALGIAHDGDDNMGIVTASFGVAAVNVSESSFEFLTAAADAALYGAKRSGRNRVLAAPDLPQNASAAA
jgi:diguanylate cyclase (GGDEF)-like protein